MVEEGDIEAGMDERFAAQLRNIDSIRETIDDLDERLRDLENRVTAVVDDVDDFRVDTWLDNMSGLMRLRWAVARMELEPLLEQLEEAEDRFTSHWVYAVRLKQRRKLVLLDLALASEEDGPLFTPLSHDRE